MLVLGKPNGVKLAQNFSYVKQVLQEAAESWPHSTHNYSDYDDDKTLTAQPLGNRRPLWQRRPPEHLREFVLT